MYMVFEKWGFKHEFFWAFGHNKRMNKKRKHQSFKEYWNEGYH